MPKVVGGARGPSRGRPRLRRASSCVRPCLSPGTRTPGRHCAAAASPCGLPHQSLGSQPAVALGAVCSQEPGALGCV